MINIRPTPWHILFASWLVALFATAGALFIGEVMGQSPCVLCWYQRIFMFPLVFVLGTALWVSDMRVGFYALPIACAGWLVAGFHTLLYFGIIPRLIEPCGQGPSCSGANMNLFGSIPIPLLSVISFTLIILFISFVERKRSL